MISPKDFLDIVQDENVGIIPFILIQMVLEKVLPKDLFGYDLATFLPCSGQISKLFRWRDRIKI
jgi:hypothetical protein